METDERISVRSFAARPSSWRRRESHPDELIEDAVSKARAEIQRILSGVKKPARRRPKGS